MVGNDGRPYVDRVLTRFRYLHCPEVELLVLKPRDYGLEIISTPNGQQGEYYNLAKAIGLIP